MTADDPLPTSGPAPAPRRRVWRAAFAAAAAFALLLAAANVWFGPLNHDEGWYLLAARNLARGMVPYRDFLYTQGPAMPLVYGALSPLWAPFGVLGGRVLTAAFGLAAALLFARSAGRLAACGASPAAVAPASFFAFVLIALSPDWAYFSTIPKTYALGAFFLAAGFALVSAARPRFALAGACFALAAATRATLCLAAVPVFVAVAARSVGDRKRRFDALRFAAGCSLALAALYVPVFAVAPDQFIFSQTYHTARASAPLGRWIVLRAAFACFLVQGYPALVGAAAALAALAPRGLPARLRPRNLARLAVARPLFSAAAAAFVLLTLSHWLVPFPYADYNTPAMPFAAVALAVPLGAAASRARLRPGAVAAAALGFALVCVAASPWPMKWVGGRQDRFWFTTDPETPLARLREAGGVVRAANPGGAPIFTQDAYLAVEADCPVEPGFEMGPFSLFPDLDDDTARARRVHNLSTLLAAIEGTKARVASVGGYTFAMRCPSTEPLGDAEREALLDALRRRFPAVAGEWDRFGQQDTPLEIRTSGER